MVGIAGGVQQSDTGSPFQILGPETETTRRCLAAGHDHRTMSSACIFLSNSAAKLSQDIANHNVSHVIRNPANFRYAGKIWETGRQSYIARQ